jgi:hypothetical protein
MVSELEFLKSDPEEERKLKLRLLDIYNMRLDERDRRKVCPFSSRVSTH